MTGQEITERFKEAYRVTAEFWERYGQRDEAVRSRELAEDPDTDRARTPR